MNLSAATPIKLSLNEKSELLAPNKNNANAPKLRPKQLRNLRRITPGEKLDPLVKRRPTSTVLNNRAKKNLKDQAIIKQIQKRLIHISF